MIMTIFSPSKMLGILLVICIYPWELQASLLTLESTESKVTYLEQGRTLKLNVTYKYSGKEKVEVVWSFNDTVKVRRGPGSVLKVDPRAEIVGQASLHLVNTTLADNGTFSVQAIVDEIFKVTPLNFTVIILVKPVANLTCPTSVSVSEGKNFSCICIGVNGNPLPYASWFKNHTRIEHVGYINKQLRLKDIDRNDAGTYICRVESSSYKDEKRTTINVLYKPTNISFTSNRNRNIAMIDEGITLTCFADGNPKPRYRIIFNGALVRDSENGIVTILRANSSDEGTYHCLASNSEGELSAKINMTARFNMTARLNVTESDDINPSTNMFGTRLVQATTETPGCNCERCESQWHLMLTSFIVGICLGIILTYAMKLLEKRLKKKRNLAMSSNPANGQENDPSYQELDVSQFSKVDNYQALRLGSPTRGNFEKECKVDPDKEVPAPGKVEGNEEYGQSTNI